jgi:hypothetical protein
MEPFEPSPFPLHTQLVEPKKIPLASPSLPKNSGQLGDPFITSPILIPVISSFTIARWGR